MLSQKTIKYVFDSTLRNAGAELGQVLVGWLDGGLDKTNSVQMGLLAVRGNINHDKCMIHFL